VHYNADGRRGWLDHSPVADDVETFAGDIRDPATLTEAFAGADVVFHLAALIAIPYSYVSPLSYVRTNVEGTLNVLDAARRAGIARVVHTSTSETYGTARTVPIDEQHPACGQSPYAASKIGADQIATSYVHSFGLPVVTVRPFNTFGPRQSLRAVIPTIVVQAVAGGEIRLGSLTPRRDFTYVADTVEAFVQAAQAPAAAVGETFNIGTGRDVAVGDVVEIVGRLVGSGVRVVRDPGRVRPEASEVLQLVCDGRKAEAVLGWRPRVTLEEGLAETIDWFRARHGAYDARAYHV
jgi:dTDP-glucose 4,6-dehydratase